jgi:lipopolysaccharide/colanic/teichoic acid biosynthesis glycosyltransferase
MSRTRLPVAQIDSLSRLVVPPSRSAAGTTPVTRPDFVDCREAYHYTLPRWKRTFDLVIIILTAVIWLPLMVAIMYGIKVIAPGPAFYRQRRIGYHGRPFLIFKFRSMKVNAETQTHEAYLERLMREDTPMTKLDASDKRLIPLGHLLRATGLDELPQIFNVIRGEMSLVGPRPCTELEFACYQPWQRKRVNAPPGITGYWQVNGKNKTTFNEMIAMDILYGQRMSLALDIVILARTLPVLFEQTVTSFTSRWQSLHQEKGMPVPATATNPVTTPPSNE